MKIKEKAILKTKQKLEKRNQAIDISETDRFVRIPRKLMGYVFFDGKWARKIDNFPDDPDIEALYQDFMLSLEYWHNEMIINFLEQAFGGGHCDADNIINSYNYINPPSEEGLKFNANSIVGLVFNKGEMHLIGEQTKNNIIILNWLLLMKNRLDCSKKSIGYKKFKRIKNFNIPSILRPFIFSNGKEFVKGYFFPKILNKKYNTYMCNLKTLYALYECDFWERMFRYRWDRPFRRY